MSEPRQEPVGDVAPGDEVVTRLLEAYALKDVARQGWLRVGVVQPESVAAHSWGLSLLALTLAPAGLDRGRTLAIASLHDLAEALVGDITPHDGVSDADKHTRERLAMERLLSHLPHGAELLAHWHDYETGASPEARFVKALDKLDMALQAKLYAARGHDTREFVASARAYLERSEHASLLALLDPAEPLDAGAR